MSLIARLPDPWVPWFEPQTGKPTQVFYDYMREADAALRASIRFIELDFAFGDDGTTLTIGRIPAGSMLLKPISGIHVIQAFNAGSGNVADMGPSTNTDLWGTDLALGTVGFVPIDEAVSNVVAAGDEIAQLAVDLTGTAATTGIGRAVLCFVQPQ